MGLYRSPVSPHLIGLSLVVDLFLRANHKRKACLWTAIKNHTSLLVHATFGSLCLISFQAPEIVVYQSWKTANQVYHGQKIRLKTTYTLDANQSIRSSMFPPPNHTP